LLESATSTPENEGRPHASHGEYGTFGDGLDLDVVDPIVASGSSGSAESDAKIRRGGVVEGIYG
jgi:hypothetical protein